MASITLSPSLLGFHPPAFFPEKTGPGYDLPPDLESLKPRQKELTIFSGRDHGVKGGHFAISSFLSGARTADAKGMPGKTSEMTATLIA